MGIPRKGSRTLYLDSQKFRWMLTQKKKIEDDVHPSDNRMRGMLTIQEDVEKPGHFLQQSLTWIGSTTVTPEIVREIIRRALAAGWDPKAHRVPSLNMKRIVVEKIIPEFTIA